MSVLQDLRRDNNWEVLVKMCLWSPVKTARSLHNCCRTFGRKWTDELICIFVLVLAFSAALVPGICVVSV